LILRLVFFLQFFFCYPFVRHVYFKNFSVFPFIRNCEKGFSIFHLPFFVCLLILFSYFHSHEKIFILRRKNSKNIIFIWIKSFYFQIILIINIQFHITNSHSVLVYRSHSHTISFSLIRSLLENQNLYLWAVLLFFLIQKLVYLVLFATTIAKRGVSEWERERERKWDPEFEFEMITNVLLLLLLWLWKF